jgi:uncharacterized protein (DUF1800 family)
MGAARCRAAEAILSAQQTLLRLVGAAKRRCGEFFIVPTLESSGIEPGERVDSRRPSGFGTLTRRPIALSFCRDVFMIRTAAAAPRRFAARKLAQACLAGIALPLSLCLGLAGCADGTAGAANQRPGEAPLSRTDLQVLNRVTWGASPSSATRYAAQGRARFLREQLHPGPDLGVPAPIGAQIAGFSISNTSLADLVMASRAQGDAANKIADPDQKKQAQQAYQASLNTMAREAATRSLLRDIYAQDQLREQMIWFWTNHFSVSQNKADLRVMVGDYEEHAIRPHALGKFRDLLGATVRHPAMLRYLDNDQNAVNHINENYAREIMELHTMGVGSGYSQKDVQELARILSGVGVNETANTPKVNPRYAGDYARDGIFEFNPNRHDYGTKQFLGHTIQGGGMREVSQALDLIARAPATARFISRKLALAFVSDNPSPALVERMAATFTHSDGDIAAVMQTLFDSPEFNASLGGKFKDPVHFSISAVRLAYDTRPILNAGPLVYWLSRMGEPLFGRDTPDGYPLVQAAWAGPGQMATRFEIARAIGSGSAGLLRAQGQTIDQPGFPQLSNALYYASIEPSLGGATRQALGQATSPQDWNMLYLSSPDFMRR